MGTRPQLPQRALRGHRAALHDEQLVDPVLDLCQDVRGDDDGGAAFLRGAQDGVKVGDALRVQSVGRLIEEDQVRLAQQSLRQAEPLAHALGVRLYRPRGGMRQAHQVEQRCASSARNVLQVRKKVQYFLATQVIVGEKTFRQIADAPARLAKGRFGRVLAQYVQRAGAGRDQTEHQLE